MFLMLDFRVTMMSRLWGHKGVICAMFDGSVAAYPIVNYMYVDDNNHTGLYRWLD